MEGIHLAEAKSKRQAPRHRQVRRCVKHLKTKKTRNFKGTDTDSRYADWNLAHCGDGTRPQAPGFCPEYALGR